MRLRPAPSAPPTPAAVDPTIAVRIRELRKVHGRGPTAVTALDGVSVSIAGGSFVAVMGASGSGKSTLLHCAAGLDTPTSGELHLGGTRLDGLSARELTTVRRDRLGFVFQSFNLLPVLTAQENIELPSRLAGRRLPQGRVQEVARTLGLSQRLHHYPTQLSGGQQQRVAVARALVGRPDVLFADEPTGNLDSAAGDEVLSQLRGAVDHEGQTVVMVTHDPAAALRADRVLVLRDGRLCDDLVGPDLDVVLAATSRGWSR